MKHAHWDCFGGATGSSMLAACLDMSSDEDDLAANIQHTLRHEIPSTFKLQVRHSTTASMPSTLVDINVCKAALGDEEESYTLEWIQSSICQSRWIPEPVYAVFEELETAERRVHGRSSTTLSRFSASNIIHVVGTLYALRSLNVETVSCGILPLGEGSVWDEKHGLLPVPSPMTLQLLIGMPTCPGPPGVVASDLITPIAAALLRVLTNASSDGGQSHLPTGFITQKIGVGDDDTAEKPRALRLLFGDISKTEEADIPTGSCATSDDWNTDRLTQLETNLDDMTAEALAFAVELLLEHGALDAWLAPIVMKKGRAGHTLHCLCRSADADKLLSLMFRHTTTLGIRVRRDVERAALRRSLVSVSTPFSQRNVRVKIGYLGEEAVSIKAEFDDCKRISKETATPLTQVAQFSMQQARAQHESTKPGDGSSSR